MITDGLLYIVLFFAIGLMVACIAFAAMYDVRSAKCRKNRIAYKTVAAKSPTITVVVYIENDIEGLEDCFQNIKNSQYKKYDVVVADNARDPFVRNKILEIIEAAELFNSYFYKNRRRMSMSHVCRQAYLRSQKGDCTLIVTPSVHVRPDTLNQVANTINNQKVNLLELPFLYDELLSFESSYVFLKLASQNVFKKVRALFLQVNTARLTVGSVYEKSIMLRKGTPYSEVVYTTDIPVGVSKNSSRHYIRRRDGLLVKCIYLSMAALVFVCTWHAAVSNANQSLILLWIATSIWTIISLVMLENMSVKSKIHLTSSAWIAVYIWMANWVVGLLYLQNRRNKFKM